MSNAASVARVYRAIVEAKITRGYSSIKGRVTRVALLPLLSEVDAACSAKAVFI
jgi:hypothetical protein